MKDIYSIGETSKITGISVQTLRKYSNMGLITPEAIDKSSGYRYYSNNQLHLLDKIKYLRELGVSLAAIDEALNSLDTTNLEKIMKKQREILLEQIAQAEAAKELVDWYIDYFDYPQKMATIKKPYIRHFDQRSILTVSYNEESGPEEAEKQLALLRHNSDGSKLKFYRQFGYLLNIDRLEKGFFEPDMEFMPIKADNAEISEDYRKHILELPAGNYFCFFDDKTLKDHKNIADLLERRPNIAIALEYSNNLYDYGENLRCEYQILI